MHTGTRSVVVTGKICKAILLGLVLIAMFIPRGDVAFSQSSTGSGTFTFTTIDFPNAAATRPYKINATGQIVGEFFDASFKEHGFFRDVGGTFTQIDVPNSILTQAWGINDVGQIVGTFGTSAAHGFLRDAAGTFTTVDVPNATNTNVTAINGAGQIVGYFFYPSDGRSCGGSPEPPGCPHGFLRDVGGTFTTFDAPNAAQTYAYGVNDSGQIVGIFFSVNNSAGASCAANPIPAGCEHGFLRDAAGTFTTIDDGSLFTQAFGINDAGQIVGDYQDGGPIILHGFLRSIGGTYTPIDVANSFQTVAFGINGNSQIVGTFNTGSPNTAQGFLAKGKPDPQLTVPHWYQAGIPGVPDTSKNNSPGFSPTYPGNFWATDPYDSIASNIWAKGCALTTLTILANFWANLVNDPMSFSNLDPRQMNKWAGMYSSGGNVDWNNWATFPQVNLVRVYPFSPKSCVNCNNTFPLFPSGSSLATADPIQTLVNILRNGNRGVPVIIPIQCGSNTTSKCRMPPPGSNQPVPDVHFVVVTGVVSQNGTFADDPSTISVNDPGDNTTKTLADVGSTSRPRSYNTDGHITPASVQASLNNIGDWKVYSDLSTTLVERDPNTPEALGVYTSDPVEFVLTDPQSRRTGYDPVTNTLFQEIPMSAYSAAVYGDEQNPSTPAPLPFKSLDMANQMNGQYTLNVIGTASSSFTVEVRSSDAAGNWIAQTYSGITAPGISSQFTFQGTATAFAAFSANAGIKNSASQFAVGGQFTLGTGSAGINPLTQPVTLQVGTFLITIPADSFQLGSHGNYLFQGTVNGVQLAAVIHPQGGSQYAYGVAGQNAANLPTTNPVDVRFAIGSDGGNTSVNANFLQ